MADLILRPAEPRDCGEIDRLVHELAVYEKLAHQKVGTPEDLQAALFGPRPAAVAILAERQGRAVGFALYFTTFSTFLCRPGIYLEDVFVEPAHRGLGIGKAILRHLAALAVERGCARFEWRVLDWNEPSISVLRVAGRQGASGVGAGADERARVHGAGEELVTLTPDPSAKGEGR